MTPLPDRSPVRRILPLLRWLGGARAAQVTLAVLLPVLLFVLPPALDRWLPTVYPDVAVRKKVLGILPRTETVSDPRIPARKRQLMVAAWIVTGCATTLLLFRRRTRQGSGTESVTIVETVVGVGAATGAGGDAAPSSSSLPDRSTDRYLVAREIARGAMGVVYEARDRVLERDVALKEVHAAGAVDPGHVLRFRREAQALARLTHPNIVQVYDLVESAERLWMVMEMVEGESLASIVERRGPLPSEEAARLGLQVAEGLAFAHGRGVIHRDVKPSNVLVTRDGVAKVADFGVARMSGSGPGTLPGQVIGSPHYLSPEQASGREADERSDVYSMGVMLYEMLAGRRPFEGDDLMSLLSQHLTQPPPGPPPATDASGEELGRLVLRMLEKDPARRPASMEETGRLLRPFCSAPLGS